MKRVAIFGNAGGGKSTLARRLAEVTALPWYPLDLIQFREGGLKVSDTDYRGAHARLILQDQWIVDGFGSIQTAWDRFAAADTLIYIDLSLRTHYWWATKRLLQAPFVKPVGWPDKSPMWRSTLDSYRVVALCERHVAPAYRKLVEDMKESKRVHHLRSASDIKAFLRQVEAEHTKEQKITCKDTGLKGRRSDKV
jgi:adenylate kinase family enzyme